MRTYTTGGVSKDHGKWRLNISWKDDESGEKGRIYQATQLKCQAKGNENRALAVQELRKWRDELVRDERRRCEAEATSARTPTARYAYEFVNGKERLGLTKPSTTRGYRKIINQFCATELGLKPIDKVTTEDIRVWEAALLEDYSPVTVHHAHAFLKSVFTHAVQEGDLMRNPFDRVKPPRMRTKPINALDTEGVRALDEQCSRLGDGQLMLAIRLAVGMGLRRGEVCALRWQDIDLMANVLRVNHSMAMSASGYRLDDPKTEKSRRSIPFGPNLRKQIVGRRDTMIAQCKARGTKWSQGLYVLGDVFGNPLEPDMLSKKWRMFADIADVVGTQGRRCTFHDLRHTFATQAIMNGVDVKTVSAILGHSNAAMTLNVYTDALSSTKRESMERLDSLLCTSA